MGATDARNMQSNFAVNKHLHTVASRWILLTYCYDARNHELKKLKKTLIIPPQSVCTSFIGITTVLHGSVKWVMEEQFLLI